MTQNELIDALAERTGHTKKDVRALLDTLAAVTAEQLASDTEDGAEIPLPGLGKIVRKHKAARLGRNPKTGEALEIPARTVPAFRPAKSLADAVSSR